MKLLVAIHQPNFFPWLGFFHKLRHADRFILLDTVQFPKTGGNWSNRVQLSMGRSPRWFTMPVVRGYHGLRSIREMEIHLKSDWRNDLIKALHANYGRSSHFRSVFTVLEPLILNPTSSLAEYNTTVIRTLADQFGIDSACMTLASELNSEGHATNLLVNLVRAVGGTSYLCGGGSAGYFEAERFTQEGLTVAYQTFVHPAYPQGKSESFTPGLSCIDALMHCGFAGVANLLEDVAVVAA